VRHITRRAFLKDLGQGTLAVAILGLSVTSCSSESGSDDAVADPTSTTSDAPPSTNQPAPTTPAGSTTSTSSGLSADSLTWERVNLGFVSAYLLVRRGEVAIVDTGVAGSTGAIEDSLAAVGSGWADVANVIVTHLHADHIGSLGDVLASAPDAAGFAGGPDIPSISSPRPLTPVGDGDTVFGLEIIATPGHTPGSISVLDAGAGVLVAGDAMNGIDGGVGGANPQFSTDMELADESVRKLAGFAFDTVLFGHGEPVVGGAGPLVAELAANL
jgi:glyoxylase-like metal-dependent hydrolase (beta-lactamase superfamily II)